ncbi:MAG: DUF981 family protein [Candidatus Micrarchaeia archaeon]
MFVDPLAIMLLGVSASVSLIIYYIFAAVAGKRAMQGIAVPMFVLGAFDFLSGFYMSFFWPLPGAYNMLFGDPMLFLGIIMLAGGFALYNNIDPKPISIIGLLFGIYVIAEAYGMLAFSLEPPADMLPAFSFLLVSGISALISPIVYANPKGNGKLAYYLLAALLVIVVLLAMLIGITSIIGHLKSPP